MEAVVAVVVLQDKLMTIHTRDPRSFGCLCYSLVIL